MANTAWKTAGIVTNVATEGTAAWFDNHSIGSLQLAVSFSDDKTASADGVAQNSQQLRMQNFAFGLSSVIPVKLIVEIEAFTTNTSNDGTLFEAYLIFGSAGSAADQVGPDLIPTSIALSNVSDGVHTIEVSLLGWAVSDLNSTTFGIGLRGYGGTTGKGAGVHIDFVRANIEYTLASISGAMTSTLAAVTSSSAAALKIAAAATSTLAAITSSGTGALPITGVFTTTLIAITSTAAGFLPDGETGNTDAILQVITSTSAGTSSIAGISSSILAAITSTLAAATKITGTTLTALAAVTSSTTGGPKIAGSATATLVAITSTAAAAIKISATTSQTLAPIALTATGGVFVSIITPPERIVLFPASTIGSRTIRFNESRVSGRTLQI